MGPRQEPDHLQHVLLPPQGDHRLPGHGLRPGFFQRLGWPNNPTFGGLGCLADTPPDCAVVPADRRQRHPPAGGLRQLPDAEHDHQQPAEHHAGDALAVDRPDLAAGPGPSARSSGRCKEGSIEELKDPLNEINQFFKYLYGDTATDLFGPLLLVPDATRTTRSSRPATSTTTTTPPYDQQIAGFGEISYAFTDQLRLTLGERIAHTTFNITQLCRRSRELRTRRRRPTVRWFRAWDARHPRAQSEHAEGDPGVPGGPEQSVLRARMPRASVPAAATRRCRPYCAGGSHHDGLSERRRR